MNTVSAPSKSSYFIRGLHLSGLHCGDLPGWLQLTCHLQYSFTVHLYGHVFLNSTTPCQLEKKKNTLDIQNISLSD